MGTFLQNMKRFILKLLTVTFLCFLVNIIFHNSILVAAFNTLLIGLSLSFFHYFSNTGILSIPLASLALLSLTPLFNHEYKDINVILLAIGVIVLLFVYLKIKLKKFFIFIILLYTLFAVFYVSGIIRLPLSFQSDRLIFADPRTKLAITNMQNEALYVPYKIRQLLFNNTVYLYVLMSKTAELFSLNNISNTFLLANLYPLTVGLVQYLRTGNKERFVMLSTLLLTPLAASFSRTIDVFNIFLLIAPLIIYFILLGANLINQKIYFLLFLMSLLLVTSPLK